MGRERKQSKKYGVYYVGAPYGLRATGELDYQSDDLARCYAYMSKHQSRLWGQNGIIRSRQGRKVS